MKRERLYIGSNGYVLAIDPANGNEVWRTRLGSSVLSATLHHDVCVLEHEDRVFAGCRGHLFCLDAASGNVLWHNQLDSLGYNDVTLAMAGKAIQFVSTHKSSSA